MATYMFLGKHQPARVTTFMENPDSAGRRFPALVEELGGTVIATYFCMTGSFDILAIAEFADEETAHAAIRLVKAMPDGFADLEITALASPEDARAAMKRASSVGASVVTPGKAH